MNPDEIDLLSLPIGANPDTDIVIGQDELGNPVYQTAFGTQYHITIPEMPESVGEPGSMKRLGSVVGDMAKGTVQGLWDGISAPGRAAAGEALTYGDVMNTAGMVQLGALPMTAPKGAIRSGAMGEATKAETIADMLASGRAKDVTDDLMAQADPQEMFRLYAEGKTGADMPMDAASRMARAEGMGFDTGTPLYHGTSSQIPFQQLEPSASGKIGPGVYLTPDDGLASVFSGIPNDRFASEQFTSQPPSRVMPLVSTNNPVTDTVRTEARNAQRAFDDPYSTEATSAFREIVERGGFDGVKIQDQRTILDPANIRSKFARFDPRLKHLANLSAAGTGAAYFGLGDEEARKAEIRSYLEGRK